jgi:hypothetical protein
MTPIEIAEYKHAWLPGYSVSVHSDLLNACMNWCKQLDKHQYHLTRWTNVYEHTFHFETAYIGQNFEMEFLKWVTTRPTTG